MKTIDSFIEELKSISEDKRKLPLVIYAQNGIEMEPSIKMGFRDVEDHIKGKLNRMVISD